MMLNELINKNKFIALTEDIAICNGDSLELLKDIKSNSIDSCIADPLYFIDGMGNNWDTTDLRNKVKKSGVVGSLPIGMKFDGQQGKDLQETKKNRKTNILIFLLQNLFFMI